VLLTPQVNHEKNAQSIREGVGRCIVPIIVKPKVRRFAVLK
jgi:hypothetical protein